MRRGASADGMGSSIIGVACRREPLRSGRRLGRARTRRRAATSATERRGTVMGIVSTSYDVGNVVALVLSAALVQAGAGWRGLFIVNPRHRARRRARRPPGAARIAASHHGRRDVRMGARSIEPLSKRRRDRGRNCNGPRRRSQPWRDRPPARPPTVVLVRDRHCRSCSRSCARAFMTWTPRFLYEVSVGRERQVGDVELDREERLLRRCRDDRLGRRPGASRDRLGPGRRAPVMTASLALLVVCTLALAHAGVHSPLVATAGVAACGLFLLGPYSLLAGAVSLDVAAGAAPRRPPGSSTRSATSERASPPSCSGACRSEPAGPPRSTSSPRSPPALAPRVGLERPRGAGQPRSRASRKPPCPSSIRARCHQNTRHARAAHRTAEGPASGRPSRGGARGAGKSSTSRGIRR